MLCELWVKRLTWGRESRRHPNWTTVFLTASAVRPLSTNRISNFQGPVARPAFANAIETQKAQIGRVVGLDRWMRCRRWRADRLDFVWTMILVYAKPNGLRRRVWRTICATRTLYRTSVDRRWGVTISLHVEEAEEIEARWWRETTGSTRRLEASVFPNASVKTILVLCEERIPRERSNRRRLEEKCGWTWSKMRNRKLSFHNTLFLLFFFGFLLFF